MKKRRPFLFISLAFILLTLYGCEDDNKFRTWLNEEIHRENSKIASERLSKLMYNTTDNANRYERFKMIHISDPHLSGWSSNNNYKYPINLIQSVRYANQEELRINAMVATGDFISNFNKKDVESYMKSFFYNYFNQNRVPSFICTGNHDANILSDFEGQAFNKAELHNMLFSYNRQQRAAPEGENYYYADVPNPQGGFIRIISLDMIDQPEDEYDTLHTAVYSQKQIDWFGNIALKEGMTDNHSIIILNHFPLQPTSNESGTYLCDGDFLHPFYMIPAIVDAYSNRSTLNMTFENKIHKDRPINVDFNFTSSAGEFICYLGGHAHVFATFYVGESVTLNNRELKPQLMILCTNQAPSEVGTVYNRVTRIDNSYSSNCFNQYAIDTREKKIYITFFGAYIPNDQPDFPDVLCISYQ